MRPKKIRGGDQAFVLPKIRNNHCDRRGAVKRKEEVQTFLSPHNELKYYCGFGNHPAITVKENPLFEHRGNTDKSQLTTYYHRKTTLFVVILKYLSEQDTPKLGW